HFLRVLNAKYGKTVREISAPARELLLSYPWPGNVRELSHVIERAVLWSRGPTLDVEHLSLTSPDHGTAPAEVGAAPALPPQGVRSEEHTSELQSLAYLVCRLLLEKKKK